MIEYPQIDPIAFAIGPFQVHWYGLMYVFAFLIGWFLARLRASKAGSDWTKEEVDDIATWSMLGVVVGARLGYVFFYDFAYYIQDPMEIFYIWNGGMSFHGGLIGVFLVLFAWSRSNKKRLIPTLDFVAPVIAPGLLFGRIANFINGELWGKVTDVYWGIIFPRAGMLPRHPTQLYEAFLEGFLLFIIIWIYSAKERAEGAVAGWFAIFYSFFRIGVEFFREPDAQLGYLYNGWITMGMLLSLPLLFIGICLVLYSHTQKGNPKREKIILEDGSVVWLRRR